MVERLLMLRWVVLGSILHGGPIDRTISNSSQYSTTGVTKTVVCVILSMGLYI